MKTLIVCVISFCLLGTTAARAQSMLEYGALATAAGAAGAAAGQDEEKKEDDKDKGSGHAGGLAATMQHRIYDQSMKTAAERGVAILHQLGQGPVPPPGAQGEVVSRSAPAPAASPGSSGETARAQEAPAVSDRVKVVLNSGTVIEGRLMEQTAEHVRIESAGVAVTFFSDEVSRVLPADQAL